MAAEWDRKKQTASYAQNQSITPKETETIHTGFVTAVGAFLNITDYSFWV